jgi:cyclophilin family peptidyl-prolyl cis-trans isomerase
MKSLFAAAVFLTAGLFAGCTSQGEQVPPPGEAAVLENVEEFDTRLLVPSIHRDEAPARMELLVKTSKGDIRLEVNRKWAPAGADRFYNLVKSGFFNKSPFYRVNGTVAQFAYNGNPEVDQVWKDAFIPDDLDLPAVNNKKGFLTFAQDGPGKRNTQLFFNLQDNDFLDGKGFPPIGRIIEGLDVLGSLYAGYGEGRPVGNGPLYKLIYTQGNVYLKRDFPKMDYILGIEILE